MSAPIKGFPSANKVSNQRDLHYSNVEPVYLEKDALSIKAYQFAMNIGSDAAEAGTTTDVIVATAHAARAGDIISFTSGALSGREFSVLSTVTDAITLSQYTSVAAAPGDTFDVLRHKVPTVDATGAVNTNAVVTESAVYPEDSAHVSGEDGKFVLAVRNDAGTSLVDTDGDYAPVQVDSTGAVRVTETVYAEDSAHVSGNSGNFVLAVRNDAASSLVGTDGDYAPLQVDANGNLKVAATMAEQAVFAEDSAHTTGDDGKFVLAVRNDAGTSLVGTDGDYAPLQVDATGALRVAATLSEQAVYAEDSAHVSGDDLKAAGAVRNDSGLSLAGTDGDYIPFTTDSSGNLWIARQGRTVVDTTRNDYTGVNVTTGAWVQLIASTSAIINEFDLFDSSGETLELGTGAAAAETRLILIFPGGNGNVPIRIPAGTRISIRAVSNDATVGELDINWYS